MVDSSSTQQQQRERSRSPRRRSPEHRERRPSRSPRRHRRSYSPRSRSRSREDYRRRERSSRSPMSGSGHPGGFSSYSNRGGPTRSFEERAAAKDAMMQSLRDSSQQDRRVYVGNLSYDVKWHHLKDFMRQGEYHISSALVNIWVGVERLGAGDARVHFLPYDDYSTRHTCWSLANQ